VIWLAEVGDALTGKEFVEFCNGIGIHPDGPVRPGDMVSVCFGKQRRFCRCVEKGGMLVLRPSDTGYRSNRFDAATAKSVATMPAKR